MEEAFMPRIRRIVGGNLGNSLRMKLHDGAENRCTVAMPTDGTALNAVERVHGGAIAALIDTAATGAAWATPGLGPKARGTTVSITVNYLSSPAGETILAAAQVTRRGRSMVFLEVSVTDEGGEKIAQGVISYKLDPDTQISRR